MIGQSFHPGKCDISEILGDVIIQVKKKLKCKRNTKNMHFEQKHVQVPNGVLIKWCSRLRKLKKYFQKFALVFFNVITLGFL